jgi:hypothetical protein
MECIGNIGDNFYKTLDGAVRRGSFSAEQDRLSPSYRSETGYLREHHPCAATVTRFRSG